MNKQTNIRRSPLTGRHMQARLACVRFKSYLKRTARERRLRLIAAGRLPAAAGDLS